MLKFFATPYSSNSEKVHFLIEEFELPYELQTIDLAKGENRTLAYQNQNFHQRVPSIDLDGYQLFESQAILRYLANRFDRFDWYPVNLEERGKIDANMDFAAYHIGLQVGTITWERLFAPKLKAPTNESRLAMAEQKLPRELGLLEQTLLCNSYLCGPRPTLADACLLPALSMAAASGISLSSYPLTKAWIDRMSARRAWQKVVAQRKQAPFM